MPFFLRTLSIFHLLKANQRGANSPLKSHPITRPPKRILVVGCSGGGKSTLTRALSEKFKLPAVHLDVHFWKAGWQETDKKEWRNKIETLTQEDQWVMDGTFADSFDIRFPRADFIIVLDQPRLLCLSRAILRVFKYSKVHRRPDMAEGCDESFNFEFYKYIWNYNKKVFPEIIAAIDRYSCQDKVIYLSSDRDVERFLRK